MLLRLRVIIEFSTDDLIPNLTSYYKTFPNPLQTIKEDMEYNMEYKDLKVVYPCVLNRLEEELFIYGKIRLETRYKNRWGTYY